MAYYLSNFIQVLFQVLTLAILARVLISWFPISRDSLLVTILYDVTEPILGPLRRVIPSLGNIDISPIVALVLLQILQGLLLQAVG